MAEATTLGTWLRRERERRGVTLTDISDQTKLSVPLLKGLEADDLSRWPGGIFRRAFARSYAAAIGVDPDLVVRRVEEEHPTGDVVPAVAPVAPQDTRSPVVAATGTAPLPRRTSRQLLSIAALLDLLVAGAVGMGFAAAGSRLLWPVVAIAAYHALGVLLTGRSPMLALLLDQVDVDGPAVPTPADDERTPQRSDRAPAAAPRTSTGRLRHSGRRSLRGSRARA